jgi:hypothetical protein
MQYIETKRGIPKALDWIGVKIEDMFNMLPFWSWSKIKTQ